MSDDVQEARYFIESETMTARLISSQLAERGETAADNCIAWIVNGGLEGNPKAVTIMRHAYLRFLNTHGPATADNVVERYLEFYVLLARLFKKGGIKV